MSIIIAVQLKLRADKRDQALAAAVEMQAETASEPGCNAYRFYTAVDDPNAFFLFEHWESEEALREHLARPPAGRFRTLLADVGEAAPTVTRHEVSGSGPLTR